MTGLKTSLIEAGVELDDSEISRLEAGRDFGGLARGQVLGVARPANVEALLNLVRFATKHGVTLTARGAGRSQSGQSIPHEGLSVSMERFVAVDAPNVEELNLWCESGATWRSVVQACSMFNLVPPVLPLNLDLSVGGVLSAGGVGSTSHAFGTAVENVSRVEVVTGAGKIVECGPDHEPDLFRAVMGGLGRVGFITRAQLRLRRVLPRVRTLYLHYNDVERFLHDQQVLSTNSQATHLEGFCAATIQGLRKNPSGRRVPFALWSYGLHVSTEYENNVPDADSLLSQLNPDRVAHVEHDDTIEFANRYDVRFEAMRVMGSWEQAHPWFECLIPTDIAAKLVPGILDRLPLTLGDGHRVTLVCDSAVNTSFMRPKSTPAVTFAVLPMGVADSLRAPTLAMLAGVERVLLDAGGKRYLSGWLFEQTESFWRDHFGDNYESWKQAKVRYDPHRILRSTLFPE